MNSPRSEAELVTLRKLAQELAEKRKERLTSVHLLAAVASRPGPGASLLEERRLDADALIKAARTFDEEEADPIGRAMVSARELGARSSMKEPGALHLLVAMLADRRGAAHRALVSCGVDVGRLRTAAMQMVHGVVAMRRTPSVNSAPAAKSSDKPAPRPVGRGVTVPLFPPAASPSAAPAPTRSNPSSAPVEAAPAEAVAVLPPAPRRAHGRRAAESETAKYALDRVLFPTLAALGKNLTEAAHAGQLDPVVGRESEIDQILDVLAKRSANSACLVGPPGVGKTSVAHGVAAKLAETGVGPSRLLVEIAVPELVAGTGTRGALAEKVAAIRAEIQRSQGAVVLFVDQLVELFGGGPLDEAASEIKVALARGELRLIGTATPEEHRRVIESDPALARRFSLVEIDEPDEDDAFLVLDAVSKGLASHHGVAYAEEALALSIAWSVRYLPGRALPDKAISILDLAGARVRRAAQTKPHKGRHRSPEVTPAEVALVVSEWSGVPKERLLQTDRERMVTLDTLLGERVVGHREAIAKIATILRRNAAGLRGRRPIGSFLLLGPTGVGKTETAKAVAEVLFGSPDAMTRLDLSEYAESHSIARLVGAPPGYVGHEAGGQLTEAVRKRPYQVILLDEIEKADRDVLEAFLQVFDEGRLTDGRGRSIDFTNTVLVLTSNLGAREAANVRGERPVGFARSEGSGTTAHDARAAAAMVAAAKAALPPELYNRLDEVLCFGALTRDEVASIAKKQLAGLSETLERKGLRLEVEETAIEVLLREGGYDPELGARPMRRAIARLIEAPIAELILRGDAEDGAVVLVTVEDGVLVVDAVEARAAE